MGQWGRAFRLRSGRPRPQSVPKSAAGLDHWPYSLIQVAFDDEQIRPDVFCKDQDLIDGVQVGSCHHVNERGMYLQLDRRFVDMPDLVLSSRAMADE